MLEQDAYVLHYLTALFNKKRPLKLAQLIHVFHGRRTPSMLYIVEVHQLFSAFHLFPKLKREELEQVLQGLVQKEWLLEDEKGYLLTPQGEKACADYFEEHSFPKTIESLQFAKARTPFWERFLLLSQVFSEMLYKNAMYSPVIKHPVHQEAVRIWLSKQEGSREEVAKQWARESVACFHELDEKVANRLAFQLAGHQRTGLTKRQAAQKMDESIYAFHICFEDAIEELVQTIKQHKWPLLSSVLEMIQKETHFGLTDSTYETARYLGKGLSIDEIATRRRLKESTIREHILEAAFVQPTFSYQNYISEADSTYLHEALKEDPMLSYREVRKGKEDLAFMPYRLVQLERMRQDYAND